MGDTTEQHPDISDSGHFYSPDFSWLTANDFFRAKNYGYQPLIVLFVFISLFIGSLLREVNKKTSLPFSVMLLYAGILLGRYKEQLGIVGEATDAFSYINPHLALFVFVPTGVFESGFNCDWYAIKRQFSSLVVLAGPGVLLNTFLIGFCLRVILGYGDTEIPWTGALMIGAALSPTDPGEVLGILKGLGSSIRFNTLLEGESMINGGMSLLFYQIFNSLTKMDFHNQAISGWGVAFQFFSGIIGGPILGLIFGIIGAIWVRRIIRDDVLTLMVMFFISYFLLYICEYTILTVSGVLAIVVLGLYMAANGKTKIYSESEYAVRTVFKFLSATSGIVATCITGVLIGIHITKQEFVQESDWYKLPILWFFIIISRFVMYICLLPLLSYFGTQISKQEMFVFVYGGIKGGLPLTMSMMIAVDPKLPPHCQQLGVFFICGIVSISMLVQSLSAKLLINYLNYIDQPQIKPFLLRQTIKELDQVTKNKEQELHNNRFLNLAKWDKVQQLTQLQFAQNIQQEQMQEINKSSQGEGNLYVGIQDTDFEQESRYRILRSMKGLFWEKFEKGEAGPEATKMLDEACNVCLENTLQPIAVWSNVFQNFTQTKNFKFMQSMKGMICCGGVAKNQIVKQLSFVFETANAFIVCSQQVKIYLNDLHLKKESVKKVLREVDMEVIEAENYIQDCNKDFQEIITAIHTKRAAMLILDAQKTFLTNYKNKGFIDQGDYDEMRTQLDRNVINLDNYSFPEVEVNFNTFLMEYPIFRCLSNEDIFSLQQQASEQTFLKDQYVFTKGQKVKYIFTIMSGVVEEQFQNGLEIQRGIGQILSYNQILSPNNEAQTGAIVKSDSVTVKCLEIKTIVHLTKKNKTFEEKVLKNSVFSQVKVYTQQAGILGKIDENTLNTYITNADVIRLDQKETCKFPNGGYIMEGEIQKKQVQDQFNQPSQSQSGKHFDKLTEYCYIEPSQSEYEVIRQIKVLSFKENIKQKFGYQDEEIDVNIEQDQGYIPMNQIKENDNDV